MKEKIIEILESHENRLWADLEFEKKIQLFTLEVIAGEILELFKSEVGRFEPYRTWIEEDKTDSASGYPDAQELNMKAVRCDCRHCQPDLWKKDDRDIWINISP